MLAIIPKTKINIAIDGYTASGKTTIGKELASQLNYQFIDSGLFYRYIGYYYYDNTSLEE
ncbi:4423_t:CDS:1, partial [Racocetra fulgida]